MIRGEILNSRARRTRRPAPAARALAGAAVAAASGLVVSLAAAAVPALAAQHPGGPAAGQARAATGEHAAGRMSPALWAHIAAGGDHTCGIRTDGTLWCWGDNSAGELGLGNHIDHDLPQQVTTPAAGRWASITAGTFYTCATRSDGTLWCWGSNDSGALGLGVGGDQNLPRQVTTPAGGGWASITAGGEDTCGIRTGGTLWCWGYNDNGELGIGNHADQDRPRQVTG